MSNETREYGPREKLTCNLPHGEREWSCTYDGEILHDLETALCVSFGGYTSTPMVGGWLDGKGNIVHEPGTSYTVSYPVNGMLPTGNPNESADGMARRRQAIAMFVEAGERLGEEWIHIERSDFQAEHRRTSNGQGEYDNSPSVADAPNVERIRQLDKETRDHINSGTRSTDHVRR